jgi:hypothetical protein
MKSKCDPLNDFASEGRTKQLIQQMLMAKTQTAQMRMKKWRQKLTQQ